MAEVHLGQLRVPPVHQHILRVLVGSGVAVIEAAEFDGLSVRNDDLVMVDGVHADGSNIDAAVDERRECGAGLAAAILLNP